MILPPQTCAIVIRHDECITSSAALLNLTTKVKKAAFFHCSRVLRLFTLFLPFMLHS